MTKDVVVAVIDLPPYCAGDNRCGHLEWQTIWVQNSTRVTLQPQGHYMRINDIVNIRIAHRSLNISYVPRRMSEYEPSRATEADVPTMRLFRPSDLVMILATLQAAFEPIGGNPLTGISRFVIE